MKHRYSGPICTVTLEGRSVVLWPGKLYGAELDAAAPYIQRLIAHRHLVPVPEPEPERSRDPVPETVHATVQETPRRLRRAPVDSEPKSESEVKDNG